MKHNAVAALALLGLALSLEGCGGAMGLGVGAVTRAAGTGDAYAAWKALAPPIPPRLGRLFVYAPNRQVSLWTADWATGGLSGAQMRPVWSIDSVRRGVGNDAICAQRRCRPD